MGKLAAVDVGTNTALLLITEDGRAIHERHEVTRLGEGVAASGALSKDAMTRTLAVLHEFDSERQAHGAEWAGAVATAAVRSASNGRAFLMMAGAVGVPLQVISGEEEAAFAFVSVAHEPPSEEPLIVFDVGGGSTEIISEHGAVSLPVGSVRLRETHGDDVAAMRAEIRAGLAAVPVAQGALVGLAATVTSLAALELHTTDSAQIHHSRLTRKAVADQLEALMKMPLAVRAKLPELHPDRADLIVAGAAIVLEVMEHFQATEMFVSDRGVRWGLIYANEA